MILARLAQLERDFERIAEHARLSDAECARAVASVGQPPEAGELAEPDVAGAAAAPAAALAALAAPARAVLGSR